MRVCTTAFSYAGGQAVVERHLPLWRASSDEVIVVFPEDSRNVLPGTRTFATGRSNKYGEECLKRQLNGMRHSLDVAADFYVFVEYDAFLLRRPEARVGVQANLFKNRTPELEGSHYGHFPWIFDARSLRTFVDGATFEPFQRGFVDRWMWCQATRMGLPVHDLRALREGFSRNTIRLKKEKAVALRHASRGAYAFHGLKEARLLRKLREKYDGHS